MRTKRTAQNLPVPTPRGTRTALLVAAVLTLLPTAAQAIQLPTFSLLRQDCVNVAGLNWHTNYEDACDEARSAKKMLLVNFVPNSGSDAQRGLEKFLHENDDVRAQLEDYVLVRVFDVERVRGLRNGLLRKNRDRVIDDPIFKHLGHTAGLAIIDYRNSKADYYGDMVTALPFKSGKYYRWQNSHLAVALGLPAGTITQRMMVWAVRIHPEKPLSTVGTMHPALANLATEHSAYQAQVHVQGHQGWESRFHLVVARSHAGTASEVVAESWENQDLIDSCIDCVASWRQSPGHWEGVRGRHNTTATTSAKAPTASGTAREFLRTNKCAAPQPKFNGGTCSALCSVRQRPCDCFPAPRKHNSFLAAATMVSPGRAR